MYKSITQRSELKEKMKEIEMLDGNVFNFAGLGIMSKSITQRSRLKERMKERVTD